MITALKAILSLDADAEVTVGGEGTDNITWGKNTTAIPTSEIDAEIIRLEKEFVANQYQRDRAKSYDSVGDQLDQLMKDMRDGTTTHQAACEAVKAQFPKPE